MDRQGFRQKVYRLHSRYNKEEGVFAPACPLTGETLVDDWDVHEVFVRRSEVPPKHQDLIMTLENCVPVNHNAHIDRGNGKQALQQCSLHMFKQLSALRIGTWYVELWREHGLSVDKGLLASAKSIKVTYLIPLIELGAAVHGINLPAAGWEIRGGKGTYDIRAQIALRYQGKRRKWKERMPKEHNGYEINQLHTWMDEGYWASYMFKALGLNGQVDNGHIVWYNSSIAQ